MIESKKYRKLPYDKKLKYQKVKITTNKTKDIHYADVQTPSGDYSVRISINCNCHAGSNYGIKKTLCSHERSALIELLNQDIQLKDKIDHKFRGDDWDSIRLEIIERDKCACVICNNKKNLAVHHITPWRETQDNSQSNLITLCPTCHKHEDNFYTQFKKPSATMLRWQENIK